MQHMLGLRRRLVATFALIAILGAVFAVSALAWEDVFQPRKWVGPYEEGLHSPYTYLIEIQGEGWQYESCVDMYSKEFGYAEKACNTKKEVEYSHPMGVEGYARVWNAKGYNNEIWGWEYS